MQDRYHGQLRVDRLRSQHRNGDNLVASRGLPRSPGRPTTAGPRHDAPRLMDRHSELGTTRPVGPSDSDTAGTATFLVMTILFRRVLT